MARYLRLLFVATLALGCSKDKEGPKQAATGASEAEPVAEAPKPSAREGRYVARSLLEEASRAELWHDGLVINLGTPDQHKFVWGGWGRVGNDNKTLYAETVGNAKLRLNAAWQGAKAVTIHARSPRGGQKVTVYVDSTAVASQAVDAKWQVLEFTLAEPLVAGPHILTLAPSDKGKELQVDWVHLPHNLQDKGVPDGAKASSRTLRGSLQRALVGDPPRRLSYYLAVPQDGLLVFDYGAGAKTKFTVRVAVDGEKDTEVFAAESKDDWQEGSADLSRWANNLVRVDLITEGKATKAGWGEPEIMVPGPEPEIPHVSASNRAKNLIYILIDTARQDMFKAFTPSARLETPAMSRLAKESVVFTNAYANDNWTKPSVATVLTGLYPSSHNTQGFSSVLPDEATMISEHLSAHGFATAAFIANGYVSGKFGFKRGWGDYRNYIRENRITKAENVYRDATAWLKRRKDNKGRFFLYIQTIDPHVPYRVSEKYWRPYHPTDYKGRLGSFVTGQETKAIADGKIKLTESDMKWIRALYQGELAYHDEYFGKFLDAVGGLGLMDDTLIVVSNDHGEELFDHGRVGHGHSLHEELLRSPVMMRYPKLLPKKKVINTVVELVDLPVTMLDMLAVAPLPKAEGVSLLPTAHGRSSVAADYAISEFGKTARAVRVGPYKMITSGTRRRMYNVEQDRGEQTDLQASHPIAARACEIYLGEGLAIPNKRERLRGVRRQQQLSAPNAKIDPELRKQLEALGYIGG